MKKGNKVFTAVLILGILLMTGGSAMAAWTATPAGINVVSGANPGVLYAVNPGNAAAGTVALGTYMLSGAEALDVGAFVTLTLTGGAVFAANPLTAGTTPVVTPGAITMMTGSGIAGSTEAKFRTSIALASPGGILFNSTNSFNVSNVLPGNNVDILITLTTSSGTVITNNASMRAAAGGQFLFTGVRLITYTGPGTQPTDAILDVLSTPSYSKFVNAATTGPAGTLNIATGGNAGTIPAAGLASKKLLVTLTGDFTGVTRVTATGLTGCDSTGSTTNGLSGQFLINTAMTEAYATNTTEFAGANLAPLFTINGTTVQAQRIFTVKIDNFADANYLANVLQSPIDNYRFVRNGTFFSANSLGPQNNIKISDQSGRVPVGGAKVMINAWDAAGVKLAEVTGVTDILLQNLQTIELTGAVIAARFVGTPLRYEVAVQSVNAIITNVKKTPEGFGSSQYVTPGTGGGAL